MITIKVAIDLDIKAQRVDSSIYTRFEHSTIRQIYMRQEQQSLYTSRNRKKHQICKEMSNYPLGQVASMSLAVTGKILSVAAAATAAAVGGI